MRYSISSTVGSYAEEISGNSYVLDLSFNEVPSNFADELNTVLTFECFFGTLQKILFKKTLFSIFQWGCQFSMLFVQGILHEREEMFLLQSVTQDSSKFQSNVSVIRQSPSRNWKGNGATHLPLSALVQFSSICFKKSLSSTDKPGLSSLGVLLNNKSQCIEFSLKEVCSVTDSLTLNVFMHGFKTEDLPFPSRYVFLTLIVSDRWTLLRPVSPIITHPKRNFWAYGEHRPIIWSRTWGP